MSGWVFFGFVWVGLLCCGCYCGVKIVVEPEEWTNRREGEGGLYTAGHRYGSPHDRDGSASVQRGRLTVRRANIRAPTCLLPFPFLPTLQARPTRRRCSGDSCVLVWGEWGQSPTLELPAPILRVGIPTGEARTANPHVRRFLTGLTPPPRPSKSLDVDDFDLRTNTKQTGVVAWESMLARLVRQTVSSSTASQLTSRHHYHLFLLLPLLLLLLLPLLPLLLLYLPPDHSRGVDVSAPAITWYIISLSRCSSIRHRSQLPPWIARMANPSQWINPGVSRAYRVVQPCTPIFLFPPSRSPRPDLQDAH